MTTIHPWVLGLGPKPDHLFEMPATVVHEKVYPKHRYTLEVFGPEGECAGERCNRNGCAGIIEESDTDGCCSCHISPPCGYCTTPKEICPECDWSAEEEQQERWAAECEAQNRFLASPEGKERQRKYNEEQDRIEAANAIFWKMYRGEIPCDKIDIRYEGHTHFSMKMHVVYPPKTTSKDEMEIIKLIKADEVLWKQVQGTFGGRFDRMPSNQSFTYVAYTD